MKKAPISSIQLTAAGQACAAGSAQGLEEFAVRHRAGRAHVDGSLEGLVFDAPIDDTQQIIDVQPTYILVARPLRTAKAQTSDVSKRLVYPFLGRRPSAAAWQFAGWLEWLQQNNAASQRFTTSTENSHLSRGLPGSTLSTSPVASSIGRSSACRYTVAELGIEPHAGWSPGLGDGPADHLRGKLA